MTQIIDLKDGWYHIQKFFDTVSVPSFAKEAADIKAEDLAKIPTLSFADPAYRRFPCHTKAATVVSYLLFTDQKDKFPEERRKLLENSFTKKAVYWGVLKQMQKVGSAWEHRNDPATLTDDDYAIVACIDGTKSNVLPIQNPENIKAAVQHLKKHAGAYPMEYRQKAARKILSKAGFLDVPLADMDYLKVMAHSEPAYPSDIAPYVFKRADLVSKADPDFAVGLRKVANALQNTTAGPNRKISETASNWLEEADVKADLHKLYGQIPMPEEACFSNLSKTAQALKEATVQLTSGDIYATKDLVKAGLNVYKATDPELVPSLSSNGNLDPVKVAEVVPTLPLPQAKRLQRNLQAVGINKMSFSNINKKAAGRRLSEAAWKSFAAEAGLEPDSTGERFSLTFRPGESTVERAEKHRMTGLLDL